MDALCLGRKSMHLTCISYLPLVRMLFSCLSLSLTYRVVVSDNTCLDSAASASEKCCACATQSVIGLRSSSVSRPHCTWVLLFCIYLQPEVYFTRRLLYSRAFRIYYVMMIMINLFALIYTIFYPQQSSHVEVGSHCPGLFFFILLRGSLINIDEQLT